MTICGGFFDELAGQSTDHGFRVALVGRLKTQFCAIAAFQAAVIVWRVKFKPIWSFRMVFACI